MRLHTFRFYLTAIILFNFGVASAQDYAESALLFSRTTPAGSARILGMGGAQTSLGGDFSSAASNPAGLGMFNRSEFTFSLGLTDHQSSTNYSPYPSSTRGMYTESNRSVFNVPAISYVWNMPNDNSETFFGGSLAFSFSRVNDFNRQTIYRGDNEENSIIDYFIDQAWGETTDQFFDNGRHVGTPTGLAYFNYLIGPTSIEDPQAPDDEYFTDAGYPFQTEEILVKGASNQWSVSYGGNVKDMFFFGGGIGISSLRYKSTKTFDEDFGRTTEPSLEALQLTENLEIRGSGFNATLGAIVRPVRFLQFGLSYTTPTFYTLSETYDASMWSRWDDFDYYQDGEVILGDNSNNPEKTDLVVSDYNFTAPAKLRGGITFLSKYGFITADVEMVNLSGAKYGSRDTYISFDPENQDIKSVYDKAINYRVGAEFRKNIVRLRAGYAVQGNTFSNQIDADNTVTSFSGGAGVRLKTFYIDLAIIHSKSKEYQYRPYTFFDGSGPAADITDKTLNGLVTVGFTF